MAPESPLTPEQKIPLWLDCDPGHDDAFAILLSSHHVALRLLGISTVHGNASLDKTTENALSILDAIGHPHVPVFAGASRPRCREARHAPEIHGASGLDGTDRLPRPSRQPHSGDAVVEMRSRLMACPANTAWLVTAGSLTNAALLFSTFPEVAHHLRGLSVMGGAMGGDFTSANLGPPFWDDEAQQLRPRIGNYTPYAEFNIWSDPESARSIFSNAVLSHKTTLIPLDLTHQALATSSIQHMILHGRTAEGFAESSVPRGLRQMFHELLIFFAHQYSSVFGFSDGPPLHDPLAVAVLLEHVQEEADRIRLDDRAGERFTVHVHTAGHQIGRTVAEPASDGKGVRIPRRIAMSTFWRHLDDCLDRAVQHTSEPIDPSRCE